ncbi:MAG: nuclear transport factor 2 family protein [Chitinophagaceae bacterium]|nr:MAG: nuclear transport factor 2 family protein [Chitinophagaceae bacterium]
MQNKETKVVSEFLTAVQTGDMATVGALLHPEVKWQQPGSGEISGMKRSAREVFQMVTGMFEISANTLKLQEIKWVSANGSSVAALLRWTATKPSGMSFDVDNIDVYTVSEGKITAVTIYSSDITAEDSFWQK